MSNFNYKLTSVKTLSWRFLSTAITVLLIYLISSEQAFKILSIIAVLDFSIKFLLFVAHERIWYNIFKRNKRNASMHETQDIQRTKKN